MNACRHGTKIGSHCPICNLIVGATGPTPAPGQIWVERGGKHGLLQIEEIQGSAFPAAQVILSPITAAWCGSFPLTDFQDEFWYWGPADELSELLRSGVSATRRLVAVIDAIGTFVDKKPPISLPKPHFPDDVAAVAYVVGELIALRDLGPQCLEIAEKLATHFELDRGIVAKIQAQRKRSGS